jgi:hypothetical protein
MNLRVDLILESEQRSASIFNLKSTIRFVTILIPSIIILLFLVSFAGYLSLKGQVKALETENEIKQPKVTRADALSVEVAKNESMRHELSGLRNSAIDWHVQLVELMKLVPAEMYFDSIRAAQAYQKTESNMAARKFSLTIAGKSKGAHSEDNVLLLKRALTISDFFNRYMPPPEVPVFNADESPGAEKTDRIFRIECSYKPRTME